MVQPSRLHIQSYTPPAQCRKLFQVDATSYTYLLHPDTYEGKFQGCNKISYWLLDNLGQLLSVADLGRFPTYAPECRLTFLTSSCAIIRLSPRIIMRDIHIGPGKCRSDTRPCSVMVWIGAYQAYRAYRFLTHKAIFLSLTPDFCYSLAVVSVFLNSPHK